MKLDKRKLGDSMLEALAYSAMAFGYGLAIATITLFFWLVLDTHYMWGVLVGVAIIYIVITETIYKQKSKK